ncbi:MAG TPA: enoyl-CoA hydratase-related protein, partial [Myxococcaceae bacterium]|nr:enoyl-CoA hydratase-related protein [Myxococcaceae bacterium]
VLEVLPAEQLLAHCKAVAGKILKNGPLAVSQAKRVIEFGADQDLRAANELERQGFAVLFGSEDQKEGMKAFLEKRPAGFTGK